MPKKTKKEKILTDLRKKMHALSSASKAPVSSPQKIVKSQNNYPASATINSHALGYTYKRESVSKPNITIPATDYSYVKKDLLRIAVFTFVVALLEGMLYFFLYRG